MMPPKKNFLSFFYRKQINQAICRRWRRKIHTLQKSRKYQPNFSWQHIGLSYVGSFLGIAILAYLSVYSSYPLIAAPFGAMEVFLASFEHIEQVSELFDRYRIFYKQSSDLKAARKFLQERFQKRDSTVFVASDNGQLVGFTQLYPSFSSVSMKPIWILNDLFVEKTYRNHGVAKLLMNAAENFARETGAIRITLATEVSNIAAQSLYESLEYSKEEKFYHYALQV